MPRLAIAYLMPVSVIIFYLCLTSGAYLYGDAQVRNSVAERQLEWVKQQVFRTQHLVESALLVQDLERIEQEVSLASTDPNVMVYILLDSASKIRFANHLVWRNSNAIQVIDGYLFERHYEVVSSTQAYIHINEDRLSIQAYYPLIPNSDLGPDNNVELLYVEYDLSLLMAKASNSLQKTFYLFWGAGTVFLLILLCFLHWLIIRPLKRLNHSTMGEPIKPTGWLPAELNRLQDGFELIKDNASYNLKRLNDSEQRWLFAVNGNHKGIWDWNIATGEVFMSDSWKAMLGCAPLDNTDDFRAWKGRIHVEDKARVLQSLQEHLNGDSQTFECVYRLRHRQGHYIWVLDRGMLIDWDDQGRPSRIIGMNTDVSDSLNTQNTPKTTKAEAWLEQQMLRHTKAKQSALFVIRLADTQVQSNAVEKPLIQLFIARLSNYLSAVGLNGHYHDGEYVFIASALALASASDSDIARRHSLAIGSDIARLLTQDDSLDGGMLRAFSFSIGIALAESAKQLPVSVWLKQARVAASRSHSHKSPCSIYSDTNTTELHGHDS
ncbi:PAS domain-containing protein [Shewanella sp. AS16]|uniref:PAS domain-containing protein n=1 Tax=Shewanella sp. AS16 TaxID=2907625 RepID=UPI001F1CED72|nr:PAS domain-containing protein [Shewanella sp. AS16]MCE9687535.1 PAS domain-containing protein [Shewanella sp. AS16]